MITGGGGEESSVPPSERPGTLRRRLDRVPLRGRRVVLLGVVTGFLGAGSWGSCCCTDWSTTARWTGQRLYRACSAASSGRGVVCLQRRSLGATLTRGQLDRALRDGRLPE